MYINESFTFYRIKQVTNYRTLLIKIMIVYCVNLIQGVLKRSCRKKEFFTPIKRIKILRDSILYEITVFFFQNF